MAKKSKRNKSQSTKQAQGTVDYIYDGAMALPRTVANSKREWSVEKLHELSDVTQQYAQSLDDIPDLGAYATAAATSLQDLGDYVQETEFDEILQDASHFARRHPVSTIVGAAIAGLAIAQILRSKDVGFKSRRSGRSSSQRRSAQSSRSKGRSRGANGHNQLNA